MNDPKCQELRPSHDKDSLQSNHTWRHIFQTHRTGTLITKCHSDDSSSTGNFYFCAIKYLIFLSPHLTTHFLYLKILTEVTSDLPWHEMHEKLHNSLWGGEGSSNPNFSSQEHKEKNTCTGFHISLLHILRSLLTDSNNQDTRILTAASSTSLLKDSSYWFLTTLPSWSLKQARVRSGNIQEKAARKRWLQADPSTQEVSPWLKGLVRLSISQQISKRLQGFLNFRITTWQKEGLWSCIGLCGWTEPLKLSAAWARYSPMCYHKYQMFLYTEVHISWPETWI